MCTHCKQYFAHGSLLDFLANIANIFPSTKQNWATRLRLVGDYLAILDFLHNSPMGKIKNKMGFFLFFFFFNFLLLNPAVIAAIIIA